MSDELVVVVSGGEPPDPRAASAVPPGAPVIAADRGLEHAVALGLTVTVAIGDFDSAAPDAVTAAEAAGVRVVRYPDAKDATDLELALDYAASLGPARVLVLMGRGGRPDHELAALLLLGSEQYARTLVDANVGTARVHVVRGERVLEGTRGELVSLLPLGGAAEGVYTEGLVYPLRGETLEPGSSRGVSNLFAAERARVSLERGVVLAIRPGAAK